MTGRRPPSSTTTLSSGDTINIALIHHDDNEQKYSREGFENALQTHPFCKMTGVTLSMSSVSITSGDISFSMDDVASLQNADIACFSTIKGVKSYLNMLDEHLNVSEDTSDEDKRQLPNKPDLVGDIIQGISGSVQERNIVVSDAGLMAACPNTNTARECLNSGRWMANHIYYPKDKKPVALKTEALEDSDRNDEDDEDIDVEVWAASVVQAAGDVFERKFWGGGW